MTYATLVVSVPRHLEETATEWDPKTLERITGNNAIRVVSIAAVPFLSRCHVTIVMELKAGEFPCVDFARLVSRMDDVFALMVSFTISSPPDAPLAS